MMTTATSLQVQTEWAVFGADGKIVVIFAGTDAYDAAREWEMRGYRVEASETPVSA